MDFLGISGWIFDFLVLKMLPLISVLIMLYFVYKITDALPDTFGRFWDSVWRDKRGSK